MTGFPRKDDVSAEPSTANALLACGSIEVMPRTAAKIGDFRGLLRPGTRVYIAHINGTLIDDMVAAARRLTDEGFAPMPHLPARIIPDRDTLESWVRRYREEAGVTQALLLGGGVAQPSGELDSSMAMLETGIFDRLGFTRLHVAGHPEGNKDIDIEGGTLRVDDALQWKQRFSERTDAQMAIVTQFAFDAVPVITWAERLEAVGIRLPIHVGVAGPTKLQTLIKFAVACGVGPSLSVLQKRALDFRKLLVPYEPTDFLADIAAYKAKRPESLIEQIHVFPLGGIQASAQWLSRLPDEARCDQR
ncbi:methylenetetrahydrofolate reductase (NADPH) [Pseudorhizobium tarimense]|uniref:Methylenetetrahydrofolate reductase (NADPH) n=2 Tax=Pseudorhizobium tarimense TaxID=1079109 RepID=A0ABV2H384_9HYPH|nr:methylenetetrahydrofolate reductase [Pseudorhizobium tarimense]MCJ8518005.1 methylenetetrahydrofolate reductase [Pseudorhizobium tarimense]